MKAFVAMKTWPPGRSVRQTSPPKSKKNHEAEPAPCVQGREPRQRGTSVTIERRRYAPDATLAIGPLFQLIRIVLLSHLGGVRDDRVKSIRRQLGKPMKAIRMNHHGFAHRGMPSYLHVRPMPSVYPLLAEAPPDLPYGLSQAVLVLH